MVQVILVGIVMIYIVAMLGIGYFFHKKDMNSLQDYFLAGKGAGWYLVAMSFFATAIGAGGTIGLTASTFSEQSITAFWSYGISLGSAFVVAVLLGHKLPKTKNITIPSMLEDRYDEKTRVVAIPFYLLRFISTLGAQWLAAGTIISFLFADLLTVTQAAVIGAIIITTYTAMGGMSAVMWTDFIQGVILFIGLWILTVFGITQFGGWSTMTTEVTAVAPDAFNLFSMEWTLIAGYIVTLVPTLLVRQGYLQRIMSARSGRDGFIGTVLNGVIGFAFIPIPLLIGVMGLVMYSDIADPQLIMPQMALDILPTWLAGILLAALAAAVMSSGDSFLLSGSSNIVDDIYLRYMNPEATNEQQQLISRIAVIGLMVFSLALALVVPGIIDLIVFGAVALSGGVLVPWLAVFYWPRGTADAAFWSLAIGAGTTVIWWWAGYFADTAEYMGLHPVFVGLPLSIILFFAISFVQEPEYEEALETARKHNLESLEKRTLKAMDDHQKKTRTVSDD
ncbi:sodium:solute symporter [Halalkalicoccus sp. NIPERK01]|uniref:sodium:solute symporter family protein n=1 Tax=Halalkalicoccus sp. NIPERK01 TaxID=3053469 RepID=UPI00256F5A44|nr:sodium:solute symporter family protein [Halalkalicoccus sp. NIPERK01]MDL5363405.1 sodium:solute symporter family protein [Halalkalicoccus sp. NIPERK01]